MNALFPGTPAFHLAGEQGRGRLLAALDQPRWAYYRTAEAKAAVLHHGINKAHPYVDGNKRMALTAMLVFLDRNEIVLRASESELEAFALAVARDDLSREASIEFVVERSTRLASSVRSP